MARQPCPMRRLLAFFNPLLGPSEVKAKMEALRVLGVRMDMQERSQLN